MLLSLLELALLKRLPPAADAMLTVSPVFVVLPDYQRDLWFGGWLREPLGKGREGRRMRRVAFSFYEGRIYWQAETGVTMATTR